MTNDKSGLRKKGLNKLPGHFTKHHVASLVRAIKGRDEAPSEQEKRHEQLRHTAEKSATPITHDDGNADPSLNPTNRFTPHTKPTKDDGSGLSEALSIDAIKSWKFQ